MIVLLLSLSITGWAAEPASTFQVMAVLALPVVTYALFVLGGKVFMGSVSKVHLLGRILGASAWDGCCNKIFGHTGSSF